MKRLSFLDAIRGIAAFIVMCSHIHFTIRQSTSWLDHSPLLVLNASAFAVAIFFTLSGFVLFMQLNRLKIGYIPFVIRRAFRILPASTVAITISYLIYILWEPRPVPSLGPWFNDVSWPPGITFNAYLHHLPLNGGSDVLLRPIWTLVQEWRVSLIFPLLFAAFAAYPKTVVVAAFGFAFALCGPLAWLIHYGAISAYAVTAFYVPFFLGGMIVAKWWREIVLLFRRYPVAQAGVAVFMAYYLLVKPQNDALEGWLTSGIVSAILIAFCLGSSKARRVLRTQLPQYLGKISYSLYLIHIIWVGVLFRIMEGINPLIIGVTVIAVSIVSADLMYRTIEMPLNMFGRKLSMRVSQIEIRFPWATSPIVADTRNTIPEQRRPN